MNELTGLASNLFEWVLRATWQASVLAGLILLAHIVFRKKLAAAWRHGLWFLLIARLLMPAWPHSAFSIYNVAKLEKQRIPPASPSPAALASPYIEKHEAQTVETFTMAAASAQVSYEPHPASVQPAETRHEQVSRGINWFGIAVAAWIIGVTILGLRLCWTNLRFRARLNRYAPVRDAEAARIFQQCLAQLRISQRVSIIETKEVETPAVYGLFRKMLLLPEGILGRFSGSELRYIFLHELAHLKRRDLEINWVVTLLQIVHWFNPVIWFAFARLRADRELATDALVLASVEPNETRPYGETILRVIERLTNRRMAPNLVGIVESKTQIGNRLRAIARYGRTKPWGWVGLGIVAVLSGIALTDAQEKKNATSSKNDLSAVRQTSIASSELTRTNKGNDRFELRLLDYDNRTPLSGVKVTFELKDYSGHTTKRELTTQKDGSVFVELIRPELKRFSYLTAKDGYLSLRGEWVDQEISGIPEQFQIKLSTGGEIGGTVVTEAGKPIKGAEIFFDKPMNFLLSNSPSSVIWNATAGTKIATTDATGTWKSKAVWPTLQWAALRVRHPDFADGVFSTDVTKAMEAEGKGGSVKFEDLLSRKSKISLGKGVEVLGRVVDEKGSPVSKVQVRHADRRSENPFWDNVMGTGVVTTDSKGNFHIDHLPAKHIYFSIQTAGFAPAVGDVDAALPQPSVELRLEKGRKLFGHIKDKDGGPIREAHLSFQDWGPWQGVRWEAQTDAEGRFEWGGAPAEKFQVRVEKDGYILQRKVVEAGKELSINMNPVLKIAGKVIDAETKQPIEHFRIIWAGGEYYFTDNRSQYPIWGSNGNYSLDLGRLNVEPWGGGYGHEFIFRVDAKGYQPTKSRNFTSHNGDVGAVVYDVELKRAPIIAGIVLGSNGKPMGGTQLILRTPSSRARLAGHPRFENARADELYLTDEKGTFKLTADPEATHLLAVHEEGFTMIEGKELGTNVTVWLQPWGTIEATAWEYDKVIGGAEISLQGRVFDEQRPWGGVLGWNGKTDERGQCLFSYVPSVKCVLYRMIPRARGASSGPQEVVLVKPGETTSVKIGGIGRPVIGKFKIKNPYVQIDWQTDRDHRYVMSETPKPPENFKTAEEFRAWRQRSDIQSVFDKIRNHPMQFSEDGSFRIDEVVPGKYSFSLWIHDPRDPDAFARSIYIAKYHESFEVPDSKDRNSRIPLDLGTFELSLTPKIEEGKTAAPDFEALDVTGKKFKLSDFRGKYVVLDFWATWCGPCIGEIPNLRKVNDKYKSRSDFAMVSVSLDKKSEDWRAFVKKNDMLWAQGNLAESSNPNAPDSYGVQGIPAVFIVNPEGKIIATRLEGPEIASKLQRLLK